MQQRLTLQSASVVADGAGGIVTSWTTIATVWGALRPLPITQSWAQQTDEKRVTHNLRLRWRNNIATGMRLQLGTRNFLIHALVNQDESGRWLDALVEEIS